LFEQVREKGIKVTEILPGFVKTEMAVSPRLDPSKMIQPEDVAEVAVFAAKESINTFSVLISQLHIFSVSHTTEYMQKIDFYNFSVFRCQKLRASVKLKFVLSVLHISSEQKFVQCAQTSKFSHEFDRSSQFCLKLFARYYLNELDPVQLIQHVNERKLNFVCYDCSNHVRKEIFI
jgi:hypothetical protein